MGAPSQEGGDEGCKVGEEGEEGKEGEEGEASLRAVATSATANTTINPWGCRNINSLPVWIGACLASATQRRGRTGRRRCAPPRCCPVTTRRAHYPSSWRLRRISVTGTGATARQPAAGHLAAGFFAAGQPTA